MSQEMLLIFRRTIFEIGICAFAFSAVGCAVFEEKAGPKPIVGPQERIFSGEFEEVWRAASMAMQIPTFYPLKVSNMDTGLIESEAIKGSQVWRGPFAQAVIGGGYSTKIIVRVIKGTLTGRAAYKVIVQKQSQLQRDYFSEPEQIPSDGLEEKVILYRIDRELQIDRGLKRANLRKNQENSKQERSD